MGSQQIQTHSDKSIFGTKVKTCKDLICIPLKKRNHILEWYQNALLNDGTTRLFEWPGVRKNIKNFVNT